MFLCSVKKEIQDSLKFDLVAYLYSFTKGLRISRFFVFVKLLCVLPFTKVERFQDYYGFIF